MKSIRITLAALAIGICSAGAAAQDTPPPNHNVPPPPNSAANMEGQRVYNSNGNWIGTISGMTTDVQGQKLEAVTIEHGIDMRGTTVFFPQGSLQPREAGGYMTNLNGDQIKQLPKANATNMP
jgi:hypothetical protein